MQKLNKHLARGFLLAFTVTLVVVTFVMCIGIVFKITELLARGLSWQPVLRIVMYGMPQALTYSIPVSILTASLLVFGRLSADGRRLVYAGNQKGNLDIWVKDLTTGVPERIAAHEAEETQPAWDPAGKRIVFVSMRADAKGDLFLWDDGALTRLTDQRTEDAYPTFAPDGDSIYFAGGPEGLSRIERLDLDSKQRTPITSWRARSRAVSGRSGLGCPVRSSTSLVSTGQCSEMTDRAGPKVLR